MSCLPPPNIKREKTEFYKAIARKYVDRDKSLCEICTPYMKRTDFIPDRRAIWRYVSKLRKKKAES